MISKYLSARCRINKRVKLTVSNRECFSSVHGKLYRLLITVHFYHGIVCKRGFFRADLEWNKKLIKQPFHLILFFV